MNEILNVNDNDTETLSIINNENKNKIISDNKIGMNENDL
jgi:hypothetical protein